MDGVVKLRDKTVASQLHMAMCWSMELMVGGHLDRNPGRKHALARGYEIDYVRIYQRTGPPTTSLPARPERLARAPGPCGSDFR